MSYIVTNMSDEKIELADGEWIKPKEQLKFEVISDALWLLHGQGKLRIMSGDTTFEERKADAEAFNQMRKDY